MAEELRLYSRQLQGSRPYSYVLRLRYSPHILQRYQSVIQEPTDSPVHKILLFLPLKRFNNHTSIVRPGHSRQFMIMASRFQLSVLHSHKPKLHTEGISMLSSSKVLHQRAEKPREKNFSVTKSLQSHHLFALTKTC
jgi:hypothetical protein